MKRWLCLLFVVTLGFCARDVFADDQNPDSPLAVHNPVHFGDARSGTLVKKARKALAQNDLNAVLAYTNKCILLYGKAADKMEAALHDYVPGSEQFSYKALNDVAMSCYIQGEAYQAAGMYDEAEDAYNQLINYYTYGQAWDIQDGFLKPAFAAADRLEQMTTGVNYGDYTSNQIVQKAWGALAAHDLKAVEAYVNEEVRLFGRKAKAMQASLNGYATGSDSQIFKYWALNDVGTALYILGVANQNAGNDDQAAMAYNRVIKEFSYSQCWDKWLKRFWKPAEGATEKLGMIPAGVNWDFGDHSSSELVYMAWAALGENNFTAVEAYVNKTLELYGDKAKEMQSSLKDYAFGKQIFNYWALNDVATALYILGLADRNAGHKEQAVKDFQRIKHEFFYAQAWDPNGWFWKPSDAAEQQLEDLSSI